MSPPPLLLQAVLRVLYPLMLAVAVWVLLRGHNEPGGGFIGGVIAVAATAAWASVVGVDAARRRVPLGPLGLAVGGVALGLASGLAGVLAGAPYLTHLWVTVPLGFSDLKLSTVMLFDLGVFCAVWGALAGLVLELLGAGDAPRRGVP